MQRNVSLCVAVLTAALALTAGLARPAHAQTTPVVPAPQAPSSVLAYPQDKAVFLTWTNLPDAAVVGYNVYRRTADQTADKAVPANAQMLTTTFGTDKGPNNQGLTNGTPLVYFVKAVYKDAASKLVEGPPSRDVPVTPTAPILGVFVPYTIDTAFPGSVAVDSNNVLTIRGTGIDLWDYHDGHTFLAAPVAGDFAIAARLQQRPTKGAETVQDFASVGIEIRAGLLVRDQYALLKTHVNRDPAYYFEGRKQFGTNFGQTTNSPSFDAATFPVIFRLIRKGTMISAQFSQDNGATFTNLGEPQDFGSLPPVLYAGIAANGHTPGALFVEGKFDLNGLKITAPP